MSGTKPVMAPLEIDDAIDLRLVELLFFAYRDFVGDADDVLSDYHFGRAHHRVLHFVNRQPGLSVAELLEILKITKQSLGPVLRELVEGGHLVQLASPSDRRKRLLYPTENGRNLSLELTRMQSKRIHKALAALGGDDRETIEQFLFGMIEPKEHAVVKKLMTGSETRTSEKSTG